MKTDYAIIHKNWNGIEIEIRWNADHLIFDDGQSMAHLEIESIQPARAPLPITETGYRSHFLQGQQLEGHGGAVAFAIKWLDHEARSAAWKEHARASAQLSLF